MPRGTRVEVRDLFYATPARLKFMKSERAETAAIADMVKRLALAKPEIAFSLANGDRTTLRLEACPPGLIDHALARLGAHSRRGFRRTTRFPCTPSAGAIAVEGFAGLPTLHRPNALQLYLVVNGRPVRDKLLAGTVRAAYGDLVPQGRYPMLALFLDAAAGRGRRERASGQDRAQVPRSASRARADRRARCKEALGDAATAPRRPCRKRRSAACASGAIAQAAGLRPAPLDRHRRTARIRLRRDARRRRSVRSPRRAPTRAACDADSDAETTAYPLGAARAQVHDTFIIAETEDALVIVDQHAAHERLVYERLKRAFANGGISRQMLLIPEVVELDAEAAERLCAAAPASSSVSASWSSLSAPRPSSCARCPSLLGTCNIKGLLARPRRRAGRGGRRGRQPARRRAARPRALDHGLSWQRARRAQAHRRRR